MLTYEDLLAVGDDPIAKGKLAESAVNQFVTSKEYTEARDGYAYYDKHNTTIERYQKMLRTVTGRKVPDYWSANYKLKTTFFRRLITQQVQYVLGNGLQLSEPDKKEMLGRDFDYKLQQVAKEAMAGGVAFGFWNYDHLEVFGYADTPSRPGFCPLQSEEDASVRAGVRYWYREAGDTTVARYTLYEEDGYTDYVRTGGDEIRVVVPKQAYKTAVDALPDGTIIDICEENYSRLPIVPLYANDTHESELIGIRECLDCYDMIKSGMANAIDDTSEIFWLIKNSGGMDDIDLSQLIQRIRITHAAVIDSDGGGEIAPQAVSIPTEARNAMLELLRKDIYEDFQSLDVNTLSAAAKTTQEIQAAYQAMDNKCADFEYNVLDFVMRILELAGIEADPSFAWNRVVNQQEQTNMVLSAAQYLDDETILRHLPWLTPEEIDDLLNRKAAEESNMTEDVPIEGAEDTGEEAEDGLEWDDDEDDGTSGLDDFESELEVIFASLEGDEDDDEEPEEEPDEDEEE